MSKPSVNSRLSKLEAQVEQILSMLNPKFNQLCLDVATIKEIDEERKKSRSDTWQRIFFIAIITLTTLNIVLSAIL